MTPEQVIDLLALAARYDSRTVGEEDVRAWGLIANQQDWHPAAAARAVVEHATHDPMPVRPAHVKAILDKARADIRRRLFRSDVTPPRELAGDPRAEMAWRREYTRRAVDRALEEWAATGQFPDALPARPELEAVPRPELEAAIKDLAERLAVRVSRTVEPADASDQRRLIERSRRELDAHRRSDGSITGVVPAGPP